MAAVQAQEKTAQNGSIVMGQNEPMTVRTKSGPKPNNGGILNGKQEHCKLDSNGVNYYQNGG